jgi:hypothetical protein
MNTNLNLPAFPFAWEGKEDKDGKTVSIVTHAQSGFTKLEQAALMIAPALVIKGDWEDETIAYVSVWFAKAILAECNKQI